MKRLLTVVWLASATISAGAQTVTPRVGTPSRLRVRYFDSTGKFIGYLAGQTLNNPELLFLYNGTDTFSLFLIADNAGSNGMSWSRPPALYFSNAECSGQASTDNSFATKRKAVVAPWDNTLCVTAAHAIPQPVHIASLRNGITCTPGNFETLLLAVDPILNLDSLYVLPFRMGP